MFFAHFRKSVYLFIRYENIFFVPCIHLLHNYRYYLISPLIKYTSFYTCDEFLVQAAVFLSIQMSFLAVPILTSQKFPKLHFHVLTYSMLVSQKCKLSKKNLASLIYLDLPLERIFSFFWH